MAGFRLDPTISWGDIGMGVGLLITGVLAFGGLEQRVALTEVDVKHTQSEVVRVGADLAQHKVDSLQADNAIKAEIKGELKDINTKLDKLIDREMDRGGK
jgi:hypothetical protein